MLNSLYPRDFLPWMVCGDLNEIMDRREKWGGNDRLDRQMDEFKETIHSCALKDLGFKGPKFTWCNNWEGVDRIYERLDRVLATTPWCQLFLFASITKGVVAYSDHLPIWLDMNGPM